MGVLQGHDEGMPVYLSSIQSVVMRCRFKLPPLLDGLLNGHVYTSGRIGSNQSKTSFLPKAIARRGPFLPPQRKTPQIQARQRPVQQVTEPMPPPPVSQNSEGVYNQSRL
jgi:hypothetical protein